MAFSGTLGNAFTFAQIKCVLVRRPIPKVLIKRELYFYPNPSTLASTLPTNKRCN